MSKKEVNEALEDARIINEFCTFNKVKLSKKQAELYKGINNNIITTVTGPPGTSKTFTACYAAINALKSGNIKQIILIKPLETSGENLGFLPGTEKEKIMPFLQSFLDNFKEMVDGKDLKMFLDSDAIKFVPIAYMRGRTFKNAFIIVDEAQNADIKQLMTAVTRFSTESKLIIIGDQRQNDINAKYVALDFFIKNILGEEENIFHFKFDKSDIVRHPMIIKIIDNYENAVDNGLIPETKNKN